jgi:acyl-CoA synthetase (NDP forming)
VLVAQTLKPVTDVSRRLMQEHGIPAVTGGLDHAVRAVARVVWWSGRKRAASDAGAPEWQLTAGDSGAIGRQKAGQQPPTPPPLASEREVLSYLSTFGVPVIQSEITRSPEDAAGFARRVGGRVVLKIASPDKTEVGGVRLRLSGVDEVTQAWRQIDASVRKAAPEARIDGISVSPMREAGIELFVGVARDADWGLVVAVGLGGIWVEALKDTAVAVLPVSREEVLEMLTSLRAAKVLQGFRGAPAADLTAIADVVANIGAAALALGDDLAALEVNPLLVNGSHVEALDGLVVWGGH